MARREPLYPSTKGRGRRGVFRLPVEKDIERADEFLEYAETVHYGAERLRSKIEAHFPFAKEESKRATDAIDAVSDVIMGLRRIARGVYYYPQTRR